MYDFGIPGYRPRWLRGPEAVTAAHGPRLRALIGRRLLRTWLVCDAPTGEWLPDWPALLDLEGERVAVHFQKLDELSITWDGIDPDVALDWPDDAELQLVWRVDPLPELAVLRGQRVRAVDLAVERLDPGVPPETAGVAVSITLEEGVVTLHDAGDRTGLLFGPPGPGYRTFPSTGVSIPGAPVRVGGEGRPTPRE